MSYVRCCTVVFADAGGAEMLGKTRAELMGEVASFSLLLTAARRGRRETSYAEIRVANTERDGRPAVLVLLRDVTERHHAEAQTAYRTTHDPLTGLPNRYLLHDPLTQALARSVRQRRPPGGRLRQDDDASACDSTTWPGPTPEPRLLGVIPG
jgi:hypothetical protein